MKKNIALILTVFAFFENAMAQKVIWSDDFTANKGWNEVVTKYSEAIIKDGVISILSKTEEQNASATCFTNLNVLNNFELRCEAIVKEINETSWFGIIIDYQDDLNYKFFGVKEDNAYYANYKEGKLVGHRYDMIKLRGKKNANVSLSIQKKNQSIILLVNDMDALEIRNIELRYNGIGLFVSGKQRVSFDNLEIKQ